MNETVSHVSYVGCDLLLTEEWPQGIEQVLGNNELQNEGSYDVAEVALRARPRYHVAPSHGTFLQSPPYAQLAATSSTFTPKHVGRFLCLNPVVSPSEFKKRGKTAKFVHALGITPLQSMTALELQMPEGVLPNPFTDASYQTKGTATVPLLLLAILVCPKHKHDDWYRNPLVEEIHTHDGPVRNEVVLQQKMTRKKRS